MEYNVRHISTIENSQTQFKKNTKRLRTTKNQLSNKEGFSNGDCKQQNSKK